MLASAVTGALLGFFIVYSTELPEISQLDQYRPSAATELYDDQGRVIATFALQRRVIVANEDLPKTLRDAILSIEDKDFEKHWGINLWRMMGALQKDVVAGRPVQGASTITMQLARNLFLSRERTLRRKFQEVLLSIQIERRFTKEQIFTMYANQIYLGHGAYGFEAGAQYYFNKSANQLSVEEAATLAALPKSPSDYSPILNPDRALARRNLVINAMLEDGKLTAAQAARAKEASLKLNLAVPEATAAPYFVEEVRRYLEKKYGSNEVHTRGLRVYTSLNLELQQAANRAVLDGLAEYERRRGWQGRLTNIANQEGGIAAFEHPDWQVSFGPGDYVHALVVKVSNRKATLRIGRYRASLAGAGLQLTGRRSPLQTFTPGDILYVRVISLSADGRAPDARAPEATAIVSLEQDSGTQGALVALDNITGDIKAMVGGRDFQESKFNRTTQALRQVGSLFKPYVYAAALETAGVSPGDRILDAPTVFRTASGSYTPRNYDGRFQGNITLEHAFADSRNIPALKLAEQVGMDTVIKYARKFGITAELPQYLPVALGSAEITLLEQTAAFSAFPGDGMRVLPRYIRKVTDHEGRVLEENYPEVKDAIDASTARVLTSMLQAAVARGTAASARELKPPVAGKTGTTNDYTDAWFIGFSPTITCGVWVGHDEKKTLGPHQSGSQTALPVWINFMKTALNDQQQEDLLALRKIANAPRAGTFQATSSR